jgi:Phage integrase, N-terminal SAM-like domain
VQGSLGGEYLRESLDMTVWGAAQERVRGWKASGQIGVIRNEIPTIKEAVEKHVADAEARNLRPESLRKVKAVVERRFLEYCSNEGFRSLRQLDVDAVREFRNRLVKDYSANSARKRLEYLRAFFPFLSPIRLDGDQPGRGGQTAQTRSHADASLRASAGRGDASGRRRIQPKGHVWAGQSRPHSSDDPTAPLLGLAHL